MLRPIPGYVNYLAAAPVAGAAPAGARVGLPAAQLAAPGAPRPASGGRQVRRPAVRYLTDDQLFALLKLAASRPENAWPAGRHIGKARNAHVTNTAIEMTNGLAGQYDWLEGDIRLDRWGQLIMAHDEVAQRPMALDEWLAIGVMSGKGLKLDFKEAAAIGPAIELVRAHGVPSSHLIINVTVYGEPKANITPAQLRQIRSAFPHAIINLSVTTPELTPEVVARLQQWARAAGKPVMFPLRWDAVDEGVIAALKPFGTIAIWNNPTNSAPPDILGEIERMRRMGVDGMIDLRASDTLDKLGGAFFDGLVILLGWRAALEFVRAMGNLLRMLD